MQQKILSFCLQQMMNCRKPIRNFFRVSEKQVLHRELMTSQSQENKLFYSVTQEHSKKEIEQHPNPLCQSSEKLTKSFVWNSTGYFAKFLLSEQLTRQNMQVAILFKNDLFIHFTFVVKADYW